MTSSCHAAGRPIPSSLADTREAIVFRLPWIRGVCVLGVVLIHVAGIARLSGRVDWLTAVLLFAVALGRFAVPAFIVVSGFYLSLNPRNERPRRFYRRAMRPLLVSYVVYSTVYVVASSRTSDPSWRTWLWALSTGTANGTLWFIPVIVEFYLLHPLLRRMYRASKAPGRFIGFAFVIQVAAAVALETGALAAARGTWLQVAAVAVSFLPYVGYFVAGYLLLDRVPAVSALVARRGVRALAATGWLTAAAILAAWSAVPLLAAGNWAAIPYPRLATHLLAVPMTASALLLLLAWILGPHVRGRFDRFVGTCGLYAFGMYYVHPAVLLFVSLVLTKYGGLAWDGVAFYVLAFPIVVVVSAMGVKLLARLPFTRYLA